MHLELFTQENIFWSHCAERERDLKLKFSSHKSCVSENNFGAILNYIRRVLGMLRRAGLDLYVAETASPCGHRVKG